MVEGARLADGATGHLEWNRGALAYGSAGSIEDLDLVRVGRALNIPAMTHPRLEGKLAGDYAVEASGRSLDTLALTADLTLRDSSILGLELPGVTTAHGAIANRGLIVDLDATFLSLEPEFVFGQLQLAGELNGSMKGRITIADLREALEFDGLGFKGVIGLKDSRIRDLPIARAHLPLTLAGRDLQFDEGATLVSPDGVVQASGTLALSDTGSSSLRYDIDKALLDRVGEAIGQKLAGTASAAGTVTGNATELVTTGKLHFQGLSAIDRVTVDTGDATFRVALPELDRTRARIEATFQAKTVKAVDQTIDTVEGHLGYAEKQMNLDVKAVAGARALDALAAITFEDGRQSARVSRFSMSAGPQSWALASPSPATVVNDGHGVTISELTLVNGPQRIEASGTVAVDPAAASALEIRMQEVQVADLETFYGQAVPLAGVLTGTARISGTRDRPEIATRFDLARGRYQELTFDRLAGDVRYGQDTVTLDVQFDQQAGATLTVLGTVPLELFTETDGKNAAANQPIDLRVRSSTIGLAVVTGLTNIVRDVSGTGQIDLHITGNADNPQFAGGLFIKDGAFFLVPAGRQVLGPDDPIPFRARPAHRRQPEPPRRWQ